ncbi:YlbF family regulator [Salinilacihabitans rarus]|uniref:YlbF family regulator n=1 Tax=Salinilacihabitans rarus TaxID=2961596 RepID=UPI0020C8DC94|nr:YlbF family regulator [Salinilacihabitans rarus]
MSVERSRPDELARRLGEAIADLPEYEAFESARAAVADSEHAQAKIDEFERRRREFALARQAGSATREDLETLRETQEELHAIPVMREYLEAKADLAGRLEELNEAISGPLAVDFGGEAGGCCHD